MKNQSPDIKSLAGKLGLLLLPFFYFVLVLAAKTMLWAGTVGIASLSKQLLPQILGTGGALMVILAITLLPASRFRLS
jgi:hypothetical protein